MACNNLKDTARVRMGAGDLPSRLARHIAAEDSSDVIAAEATRTFGEKPSVRMGAGDLPPRLARHVANRK